MLRKSLVVRFLALAAVIVLVGATISEAQGRRQRGRQGGNRFGSFGQPSLAILKNEYLQKELGLTPAQKLRIDQIELQVIGVAAALQREDVQKKLSMTSAQIEKLKTVQDEVRKKAFGDRGNRGNRGNRRPGQTSFQGGAQKKKRQGGNNQRGRFNFEDFQKRITEYRENLDKASLAVLTPTQVATFNRMLGKKIDVSKLRRQRRGAQPKRPAI